MITGLGTYAYFWAWHPSAAAPLSLDAMIDATADAGVTRFQICDYPVVEDWDATALDALRGHAEQRGVILELGTRGITAEHLERYLIMASGWTSPWCAA